MGKPTNFSNGVSSFGGVITPGGSNSPFGNHWFVDNLIGSDGASGKSTRTPFKTIQKACTICSDGDTIHVKGTSTDYSEAVTLTTDNVTMVGYGFGVEAGGWTTPSADQTILTLSGAKGSRITGFLFRPNGSTSGCALDISEVVANDSDSITIDNNVFKSTSADCLNHIVANGCPGYIKIYNNHFTWGITALNAVSASNTSATGWEIVDNYFSDKIVNGIYLPLRRALIKGNHFSTMTIAIDTVGYAPTNGNFNDVNANYVVGTWNSVCVAQASDSWQGNYNNFAVNAANPA